MRLQHASVDCESNSWACFPHAGVPEYETRVLSLLHDFAFKYVSDVLLDAEAMAEHAGKPVGVAEMDDIMQAILVRGLMRALAWDLLAR